MANNEGISVGLAMGLINGAVSPSAIEGAVSDWLDDHPEATTTVADGAVSYAKLDTNLKGKADAVATLSDEIGDLKSTINTLNGAFDISPNLYDSSKDSVGLLLVSNGILYPSYTDYKTTDFIKVNKNDKIRAQFSQGANRYDSSKTGLTYGWSFYSACFYKSDKSFISDSGASNQSVVTAPNDDNVNYVRLTIANSISSHCTDIAIIISDSADVIPYYSKDEIVSLKENKIPDSYDGHINELIGDYEGFEISPEETTFFYISKNMIDPSLQVKGEYVNQANGAFQSLSGHSRTGYIEIEPSTEYVIRKKDGSMGNNFRYAFYTSSKTYISGAIGALSSMLLESPATAKYIAISETENMTLCMIAKYENEDKSFEYYDATHVKTKYIQESADDIVLNLPPKVYALSGLELNIYFENITEDWEKYKWDVTCNKGKQMARGYTITPSDADAGTYTLTIKASKSETAYKEIETSLIIKASSAGSGSSVSVIVLGDSTTDNGQAVEKLNANFSGSGMTISTLGTRGTSPNNHEGRSGWKFSDYFTRSVDPSVPTVLNPFYNPTSQTFDASYYFTNSGISVPTWFFINLGINDVFGYANDTALETAMPTILGYCDSMISSLKSVSESIKIGVCVTIPPNHSQDAFGKAYSCSQTRDRCKRNNLLWAKSLIDKYKNKESDRIYLVPIHTNLDTVYNMGFETLPVNARNTSVTYQSPIGNGGVHPVESGYWQIADVYTAFIKGNVN